MSRVIHTGTLPQLLSAVARCVPTRRKPHLFGPLPTFSSSQFAALLLHYPGNAVQPRISGELPGPLSIPSRPGGSMQNT